LLYGLAVFSGNQFGGLNNVNPGAVNPSILGESCKNKIKNTVNTIGRKTQIIFFYLFTNKKIMIDNTKSILSAQYQNTATSPAQLAQLRGSGNYTTQTPLSSNYYHDYRTQPSQVNHKPGDIPRHTQDVINLLQQPGLGPVGKRRNDFFHYPKQLDYTLKGDPYLQFGLAVNHETPTALNTLFFSRENVKYLQRRLLEHVKQITNVQIKPQSENEILKIMNQKYRFAEEGYLPSSVVHIALPRGPKNCSLEKRLTDLNQAVLQEIVKETLGAMRMYMTYYKDASSLPLPLSRPTNVSSKGENVLTQNIGLYSGPTRQVDSYNTRNSIIG
jgi:hypothetical protein